MRAAPVVHIANRHWELLMLDEARLLGTKERRRSSVKQRTVAPPSGVQAESPAVRQERMRQEKVNEEGALRHQWIDVSTWDIIVIYLLTLKLDPESRKQWELNVATNSASDALPTFDQFKDLTSRYRALEFVEPKSFNKSPNAYGKPGDSYLNKPNALHVANTSSSSSLPCKQVAFPEWLKRKQLTLADPTYNIPNKIDVLLGGEVYCRIIEDGVLKGLNGFPLLQCTTFGWIISGTDGSTSSNENVTVLHTQVNDDDMLKKFWEMESEPKDHSKLLTTEEQRCEDFFASTTVRDEEGRYVVKLPLRDDKICKGNSKDIAIKRLHSLERKFEKDNTLKARYTEVIKEYEQLGHMPDLRHLVMCWRQYPVCLVADIVKMYRMVRVAEDDTDFQRIVWREDSENKIKDYKLLTVTFGTSSAPYLAVKALNQVACDHKDKYPMAAPRVHKEFYMDNLMTGSETIEEGLQIYKEMKSLLNEGGFILQKWASNKQELLDQINKTENKQVANEGEKNSLELKTDNITKILGLTWNRDEDVFQYSVNLPPLSPPATKRKIISDVSRLFDPLGWLAPCVIVAKIFIQRLWIAGIGWDEEPPTDILKDWITYREQLTSLEDFRIPRWNNMNVSDTLVELHGFSDAATAAYAAVVYLRVVKASGEIRVALVAAKTRVSPVKQVCIPRLELCGAVLLAKLLKEVATVMNIPKHNVKAWTDSTVVLAWINKHPSNWKTFVANRVSEILTTMDSSQ
ncbi:uncharacterized protein LOC125226503 [Leguminivora glycinivorella]|uniref:uncharacterized protein LOC125226503 n=1 Tax=Leguminivora glycinivorella TaxID=1035111 RepID=UPI00200E3300|nr:uncharacterized protein LOC125226503 [Leguminivora glycinivorella]